MRQISIKQLNKATKAQLEAWLPFQIVSDGELIATVLPYHGVSRVELKAGYQALKHDVNNVVTKTHDGVLPELKLSKARQAKALLSTVKSWPTTGGG